MLNTSIKSAKERKCGSEPQAEENGKQHSSRDWQMDDPLRCNIATGTGLFQSAPKNTGNKTTGRSVNYRREDDELRATIELHVPLSQLQFAAISSLCGMICLIGHRRKDGTTSKP